MSIADNVARIRERIAVAAARAGRRAGQITLVAVSKTFPAASIREAYAAGNRLFGENRVQEWESKAAQLRDLPDATWHLVGHLQSNKARRALELFTTIDSVHSLALAQRLDRLAAEVGAPLAAPQSRNVGTGLKTGPQESRSAAAGLQPRPRTFPILLEVRLAPEATKHGVEPHDLPAVVEAVRALPRLDLRGLMCIPPWCEHPAAARPFFRRLRELRDETQAGPELSMGMSHDFEVAIEEGATQVRLGTALFGQRG